MKIKHPKACLAVSTLACVLLPLAVNAAPLPDEIRQAVAEVAKCDFSQPRKAAFLLEQFTPRATGDAQQRQQLAALLTRAVVAPETTPLGRTILCQHLALVASDADVPALAKLLDNPATAADARIALRAIRGFAVGPPLPAETKEHHLARAIDPKPAVRVAALASLARFYPDAALPTLVSAMRDQVPIVSATAIQQVSRLDGARLVSELPRLSPAQEVLALDIIAQRKITAARPVVRELSDNGDETVRPAAIAALGAVGDAGNLPLLAKIAAAGEPALKAAAKTALAELAAPGVDETLLREIAHGPPAGRATMIDVVALRSPPGALPVLLAAAGEADADVQSAALKALAKLGDATIYPQLIDLLPHVQNPALQAAVVAVGRRLDAAPARVAPLLAMLKRKDLSDAAQAVVLRTLTLTGGPEALAAVRARLATQEAAVQALASWPDVEALADLCKLVEQPALPDRRLALEGFLRLAPTSNQALQWLQRVRPLMKTRAEKCLWLAALSELKDPAALALAEAMRTDPEVVVEARLAAEKIDVALGGKSQYADDRRAALARSLPAGAKLVAYLDCGAEVRDRAGSVGLRILRGANWTYHSPGDPTALTVAFAGGHVDFEAATVDPQKCYTLGFTWWDCDDNGRAQSVWAGGQQVVEKTPLPAGERGPAALTRPLPAAAIRNGKLAIVFRQEAASNCVVSELWLIESARPLAATTSEAPAVPAAAAVPSKPADNSPVATPVVKANAGAAKKVLIVTGNELHQWRQTVPVLTTAIAADSRLEISVVEDPRFMASPDLKKYDVLVLNYQNHGVPAPPDALANLKSVVESGKGLVLVHFACGAFIDWQSKTVAPDFLAIAGRVWNPKLRAHDPRGPFKVKFTDREHPITQGLSAFDTEDELYTCLDGDVPIQVLAVATSKVDRKDYPMAFILTPGHGRTFHCALGHDVKALSFDTVQALYRRGTAWAAGLTAK